MAGRLVFRLICMRERVARLSSRTGESEAAVFPRPRSSAEIGQSEPGQSGFGGEGKSLIPSAEDNQSWPLRVKMTDAFISTYHLPGSQREVSINV